MNEEDKQLAARVAEGFLQQARSTIAKMGKVEGQIVVQEALMAYVARPLDSVDVPPDSPFAGLSPSQREAIAKAATDALETLRAEDQKTT